jgi:hypothetical protein
MTYDFEVYSEAWGGESYYIENAQSETMGMKPISASAIKIV